MDLRRARFEKRITQAALSKTCGVNQGRISLIENGLHNPKPYEIEAISKALGIPAWRVEWPE